MDKFLLAVGVLLLAGMAMSPFFFFPGVMVLFIALTLQVRSKYYRLESLPRGIESQRNFFVDFREETAMPVGSLSPQEFDRFLSALKLQLEKSLPADARLKEVFPKGSSADSVLMLADWGPGRKLVWLFLFARKLVPVQLNIVPAIPKWWTPKCIAVAVFSFLFCCGFTVLMDLAFQGSGWDVLNAWTSGSLCGCAGGLIVFWLAPLSYSFGPPKIVDDHLLRLQRTVQLAISDAASAMTRPSETVRSTEEGGYRPL